MVARNMCRAISELHSLEVAHGDLSSENVMVDVKRCKVKLIDFDLSHKFGEAYSAAGNPDFVCEDLMKKIEGNKKVKASAANDNYSLAVCCFLVLGDATGEYLASLSADELSFKKKH